MKTLTTALAVIISIILIGFLIAFIRQKYIEKKLYDTIQNQLIGGESKGYINALKEVWKYGKRYRKIFIIIDKDNKIIKDIENILKGTITVANDITRILIKFLGSKNLFDAFSLIIRSSKMIATLPSAAIEINNFVSRMTKNKHELANFIMNKIDNIYELIFDLSQNEEIMKNIEDKVLFFKILNNIKIIKDNKDFYREKDVLEMLGLK